MRTQVAVPLPRPVGFGAGDEYKLALAFDGDRFLTPWLPVLGKRAPEVPLLQVELVRRAALRLARGAALTRAAQTHTGGYISAVHATAQAVPASYLRLHEELIQARPVCCFRRGSPHAHAAGAGVSQQLALAEARAGALQLAGGERGGQRGRPLRPFPRGCGASSDPARRLALMRLRAGLALSALALGSVMLANQRPLAHFFSEAVAEPGGPYTSPLGPAAKAD